MLVSEGHCQVDVERAGSPAERTMTQPSDSGTRHRISDAERSRSQQPVVHGSEQVAPPPEEVLHGSAHREESLRVRGRLLPSHLALALPRRLMRNLGAVVLELVWARDIFRGPATSCNIFRDRRPLRSTGRHDAEHESLAGQEHAGRGHGRSLIRNQQVGGSSPLAGSITTLRFVKDLRHPPLWRGRSYKQIMSPRSEQMSTDRLSHHGYQRAPRLM